MNLPPPDYTALRKRLEADIITALSIDPPILTDILERLQPRVRTATPRTVTAEGLREALDVLMWTDAPHCPECPNRSSKDDDIYADRLAAAMKLVAVRGVMPFQHAWWKQVAAEYARLSSKADPEEPHG